MAPTAVPKGFVDAKQVADKVTAAIQLEPENFRLGHTKARIVFFSNRKTFSKLKTLESFCKTCKTYRHIEHQTIITILPKSKFTKSKSQFTPPIDNNNA